MAESMTKLKCVVVGDNINGCKTDLLRAYNNTYNHKHVPIITENCEIVTRTDGQEVSMILWDTTGQEQYRNMRLLSYPHTDVFIVCYSIGSQTSFTNVVNTWVPEILRCCPKSPFVLVGLNSELRKNESADEKVRLPLEHNSLVANRVAQKQGECLGAARVLECSAATRVGIHIVLDEATKVALSARNRRRASKAKDKQTVVYIQTEKDDWRDTDYKRKDTGAGESEHLALHLAIK